MAAKFVDAANQMTETILALGPNPLRNVRQNDAYKERAP